jgi:hypothetical protein
VSTKIQLITKDQSYQANDEEHEYTLNTEVNPSSQTAFENVFGSAPPVLGSNLLLTSAIKSQPLQTTSISDRLNRKTNHVMCERFRKNRVQTVI